MDSYLELSKGYNYSGWHSLLGCQIMTFSLFRFPRKPSASGIKVLSLDDLKDTPESEIIQQSCSEPNMDLTCLQQYKKSPVHFKITSYPLKKKHFRSLFSSIPIPISSSVYEKVCSIFSTSGYLFPTSVITKMVCILQAYVIGWLISLDYDILSERPQIAWYQEDQ